MDFSVILNFSRLMRPPREVCLEFFLQIRVAKLQKNNEISNQNNLLDLEKIENTGIPRLVRFQLVRSPD